MKSKIGIVRLNKRNPYLPPTHPLLPTQAPLGMYLAPTHPPLPTPPSWLTLTPPQGSGWGVVSISQEEGVGVGGWGLSIRKEREGGWV